MPSTLDEARSDPWQCTQQAGEVADISEADRDAMVDGEDFWSMSGEIIYRHHVCPENT